MGLRNYLNMSAKKRNVFLATLRDVFQVLFFFKFVKAGRPLRNLVLHIMHAFSRKADSDSVRRPKII